jgi:hypothetical protein
MLSLVLALLLPVALLPTTGSAQDVAKENFLAEHYDVAATIEPASQSLSATAKVDFRAREASSIVRVELHPNLNVAKIEIAAGKTVNFDRDQLNPLLLSINLPSPVAANTTVSLTFTYSGLLANEENSPVPGVRLASIYKDGAYLLLPARWFPLTAYLPADRTGHFRSSWNRQGAIAHAGRGKVRGGRGPLAVRL